MNIYERLKEKYDIEYNAKFRRITIRNSIPVQDFILLKNVVKKMNIKEIRVGR